MARHIFTFDGGNYLTTMGASWFVSYAFHIHIDESHMNWREVRTWKYRISEFNKTKDYHDFWLEQVLLMNDKNLNRNKIGLTAEEVKEMARILIAREN